MTILDEPMTVPPRVKRWTKRQYNAMVERGMFQGERTFLYRGELIEMPPMGALHRIAVMNMNHWLTATFRPDYCIQIQSPFQTPGESVPEPDAAVITTEQAMRRPHPNAAILLVEVADSSLDLDHEKALDYAAAGVPEYWILDVVSRSLEVYRNPAADSAAALGFRYSSHQIYQEGQSIASLARPNAPVTIAILLATK